jgi:membrane protease YdiL (CAAX protease family)
VTDPTTDPQPLLNTTPALPVPLAKPEQRRLTDMFFGPEGLRSGWGFALYLALVVAMVLAARFLMHPMMHRLKGTVWVFLAQELIFVTCAVLPAVVMSRIERRPFGNYGLPARGAFGVRFWVGVVWGFVSLSLLLGMLRGAHAFYFGAMGEHGIRALKFAVFWAVLFLLVGFAEEFLFRGYTLFTLSRGIEGIATLVARVVGVEQFRLARVIGFWLTALALSLLFGGVHIQNPGEDWRGALSAGLIGLFFCFTVRRTGTLWFAIGLHASWDWAQSYVYGVADSGIMAQGHLLNPSFQGPAWLTGGSVGPEGSVLVFVVIGLLFAAFHFTHPSKNEDPMEARASSPVLA